MTLKACSAAYQRGWEVGAVDVGVDGVARAHMVWKNTHALRSAMQLRLFVPGCIRYAVYFADGR